ncbi:MAG TPA: arginine deiminase family protein [Candidatus Saccharimonadales bacterium]
MNVSRVLLCRPTHFQVDYVINPHMKPFSVDPKNAMKQWEKLVATLESLDIKVDVIEQEQGVPDMVFATDQGIVRDGAVVLANFRHTQRKKERQYYRKWFRDNNFRLRALSNVFSFEGGDTLFFGDMLLVGTGFRANVASCEELANKFDIDVIPLRLTDPNFYHLDTCFLPVDHENAFYYPPAFSSASAKLLEKLIPNLHEFSRDEAFGFGANSFISGNHVVMQANLPTLKQKLEKLGKIVHEVDVSEFNKSGGGIHCLINTLEVAGE